MTCWCARMLTPGIKGLSCINAGSFEHSSTSAQTTQKLLDNPGSCPEDYTNEIEVAQETITVLKQQKGLCLETITETQALGFRGSASNALMPCERSPDRGGAEGGRLRRFFKIGTVQS